MIWQILTFTFGTISLVLGYTTWNLYSKVSLYEQWYDNFAGIVEEIYKQLTILDDSGAMRADDEIGDFYSALRQMLKQLFKLGFYEEEEVENEFPTMEEQTPTMGQQMQQQPPPGATGRGQQQQDFSQQ